MSTYFTCRHCRQKKKANSRLKELQKYCGEKSCQQARKQLWDKKRRKTDASYRLRRKQSQARWRKKYPGASYQKSYRQAHGPYEQENRIRQQLRNRLARQGIIEQLVSTRQEHRSAGGAKTVGGGLYQIQRYTTPRDKKIVKTDALIVELIVHQSVADVLRVESQRL